MKSYICPEIQEIDLTLTMSVLTGSGVADTEELEEETYVW